MLWFIYFCSVVICLVMFARDYLKEYGELTIGSMVVGLIVALLPVVNLVMIGVILFIGFLNWCSTPSVTKAWRTVIYKKK